MTTIILPLSPILVVGEFWRAAVRGGSSIAPRWSSPRHWLALAAQRQALAEIVEQSPELLFDIGLTKAQARSAAAKPFWHV
jgi:uncharacterized protein YjiS (DUF1127 family)